MAIEKILDYVFHKKIHFLLDGTLAHSDVAKKNVKRAIRSGRLVHINCLYQPKNVAWEFTQEREKVINRRITKTVFEDGFENSKLVVAEMKDKFSKQIVVDIKNMRRKNPCQTRDRFAGKTGKEMIV